VHAYDPGVGGVARRTLIRFAVAVPAAAKAAAAAAGLATAGVAMAGLVAGCDRDWPRVPAGQLRIATGSRGGVYFQYGTAIGVEVSKRLPQLHPSVLVTAASAENLQMVAEGRAEIGFTQADLAADAHSAGKPVVALARLYDDYLHLVVPASGPVQELEHLSGRRVSIGAQGSGTVFTVNRLLTLAGLNLDRSGHPALTAVRLGLDESALALREGGIDAFFFSGGLPVRAVRELAAAMPIRLVDMGRYAASLHESYGQFYAEHAVPTSAYDLPGVTTIGVPNYLIVATSMPEATAEGLTRTLFEARAELARAHPAAERLNMREAIHTYPLKLHPGAMRYYRQAKR
jgi:TRAP transporter TAXI family solute receptor